MSGANMSAAGQAPPTDDAAPLACERVGHVAVLTLVRPEVLNAIDGKVCDAILRQFDELETDPAVRIVVLAGEGPRAFSAGADLRFMRGLDDRALRRFIELTWRAFDRVHQSPLVSIAALHGHVLGGGLELALACDLRVADPTVSIALPEMSLGSVPGSGAMQRLPKLIGESRCLELALSGRRMGVEEAHRVGLVNAVAKEGAALQDALQLAEACAQRPAEAIRYAKVAMRTPLSAELAPALHGLISACCHNEKSYQESTDRFQA